MAYSKYQGRHASEEFSAPRTAPVQQSSIGKDGNLDNQASHLNDSAVPSRPAFSDKLSASFSWCSFPFSFVVLRFLFFLSFTVSSFFSFRLRYFISFVTCASPLSSRNSRPRRASALAFGRSDSINFLAHYTTCIPLLLTSYGLISPSQALHLSYVTKFTDLPKSLRDGILRDSRSHLLVRVYNRHVQSLLAQPLKGKYELAPLRCLLTSAQEFLTTPYTEAELKVSSAYSSPAIPALGGIRGVLTQLVTGSKATGISNRWHPGHYPAKAISQRLNYRQVGTEIYTERPNDYIRSFPDHISPPRLPEHFSDSLKSVIAGRTRDGNSPAAQAVPVDFTRNWAPRPLNDRVLSARAEGLSGILQGIDYSKSSLRNADEALSINRYLDTRGAKIVPRWEGDQWNRWSGITSLFTVAARDRNYLSIAYRLLARHYYATLVADNDWFTPTVMDESTPITLTPLTAEIPPLQLPIPGQPPQVVGNPEAPLFTAAAFNGLRNGTKQFIDAEGLSLEELRELLAAIVPCDEANIPHVRYSRPADLVQEIKPGSSAYHRYFFGPTRYKYLNGVDEVFIHFGNNPAPTPAEMADLSAHVHAPPSAPAIMSVLRYLIMRHGASEDVDTAMELLIARIVMYHPNVGLRGLRNNVPQDRYINADGHYSFHLPRAKTASAYFDAQFLPADDTTRLNEFLSFSSRELVNSGVLFAQARATALNWATAAYSMYGRQWTNSPGTETNTYVKMHVDTWLRKYAAEPLNVWASAHNNALAFLVDWALSSKALATEANVVVNWWSDFQAPYLTNPYHELWQCNMLPSHQLLPYHDVDNPATITWPDNCPLPISDAHSFANHLDVELAKDFPAEAGRYWMGDGGSTANAQFFAATGLSSGFRFQGHHNAALALLRWRNRSLSQLPQAPAAQEPSWMGDLSTPFSDFLLPGSIATANISQNTAYSHAITAKAGTSQADQNHLARLWFNTARQLPRSSLAISYVSPYPERRELRTLQEYSIVVWENGQNAFSGMSLMPANFSVQHMDAFLPSKDLKLPAFSRPVAADISDSSKSARVTRSTPQPRARAANVLEKINAFRRADPVNRSPDPDGIEGVTASLSHEAKYPVEMSQLPPNMNNFSTKVEDGRISVETSPSHEASLAALRDELKRSAAANAALLERIERSQLVPDFSLEHMRTQRPVEAVASYPNRGLTRSPPRPQRHTPRSPPRPEGNRNHLRPASPSQPQAAHCLLFPVAQVPTPDPNAHFGVPLRAHLQPEFLAQKPVLPNDSAAYEVQRRVPKYGVPSFPAHDPFKELSEYDPSAEHPQGLEVSRGHTQGQASTSELRLTGSSSRTNDLPPGTGTRITTPYGNNTTDQNAVAQDGLALTELAKN
ncbi:hypothetical protein [Fusarium graminearum dsRNA mycovirus 3]|uniref:Uncharacterized protein n=1 Tax=Fusarium graminearum dsRNA mycovirus 3 TaxID=687917 RepID=D0TZ29_9VIRU|nr:hypothetical protein [Fusarium graminearum dsRNA mycovirus-3]ACY56322.1 hypothetical protein [Fusarium graminearum dsRNA mycovirus-3]